MTLNEAYSKRYESIRETLKVLKSKIKRHRNDFKGNPNNWGYVGDLSLIEKDLKELNKFLGIN